MLQLSVYTMSCASLLRITEYDFLWFLILRRKADVDCFIFCHLATKWLACLFSHCWDSYRYCKEKDCVLVLVMNSISMAGEQSQYNNSPSGLCLWLISSKFFHSVTTEPCPL